MPADTPNFDISPAPTEDEAAAIMAAYEALWPKPAASRDVVATRWRFSGRWWNADEQMRR
ncbi:MAG: hypothetical protein OEU32_11260 [Acidimicrobiia bacterium]|nr:hypothetical protein [Acidimicrobiia bacterium]